MTKLGFGFLRLPLLDKKDEHSVDYAVLNSLVDLFIEKGGKYFDTAYTYLNGKSEETLRRALVERYPRQDFMIADKLPCGALHSGKKAEEIFTEQLTRCGVDCFDVYLLHGLDGEDAAFAEEQGCFDFLKELKLERVGAFPFSPEEGTPAAQMEFVDNEIAQQRAQMVESIQSRIMDQQNEAMMGRTLEVLVDGYDEELEQFYGRTYADSPDIDGKVWFAAERTVKTGEFVHVTITDVYDGELIGELEEES